MPICGRSAKEATGWGLSKAKRETLWAATGKAIGVGLHKPFEAFILLPCALSVGCDFTGLTCPVRF